MFAQPNNGARNSGRSAEAQREQAYQRAEDINAQLNTMDDNIRGLVNSLNDQRSQEESDEPKDRMSEIEDVLNTHLSALLEIEQRSSLLESKLNETQRLLQQQKQALPSLRGQF